MEILANIKNSQALSDLLVKANELKNLFFKMIFFWILGLGIAYYFQTPIYNLYTEPLRVNKLTLNFLSPTDSIMFYIKIFSISGLIISLPIQVVLFWNYVKDALLVKEQKVLSSYFWVSSVISALAMVYGWIVVVPSIFHFLISINPPSTQLLLTATEYSNFITGLLLMLVVTFQLPIIVFSIIKLGLVTKEQVTSKRKQIYVSILIVTALFGSPDVFTWLLSTLPVIILFESSLLLAGTNIGSKQSNSQ